MDRAIDPCTDFFAFTCGGLVATTEIPADQRAWGPTYELVERNELFLRALLERAATSTSADPATRTLGDWWSACMDEPAIERAGLTPLEPLLAPIRAIRDRATLGAAIAELHASGIFAAFDVTAQQDFADATRVIAGLDQSGLGLPSRDDYLDATDRAKQLRAAYEAHVARLFVLAGDPAPAAKAAARDVMRLETALAALAQDEVVRRDPRAVYHKVDRPGLVAIARTFPWDRYFARLGVPAVHDLTINSETYFAGVAKLLAREPLATWRVYLRAQVLSSQAPRLGRAFQEEQLSLDRLVSGVEAIEPRWKRCVRSADVALGELLGRAYVDQRFDEESQRVAEALVADVRAAMAATIDGLPWMDDATRAAAREKLAKMGQKVGRPSHWRAYGFDVRRDAYAANALASDRFELARILAKLGKPVDRTEWWMTAPTVNAYYDASMNEMVFPAGILQPPFFSKTFSRPVNFGATGATMGHELTHGFDDEGRQFDGAGNLRDWWTPATSARFEEQTKCIVDRYSAYEAVPGVKLDGALTAGENIADLGGLALAHAAFLAAEARDGKTPDAGGLTREQLFFVAYGQSWCQKTRPEILATMAGSDPHAPERWRVNGVVSNLRTFADAFGCREGTPMRPATTCRIW